MFCLSDGASERVFEPYWSFAGNRDLAPTLALPGKRIFHVVMLKPLRGFERTKLGEFSMKSNTRQG
jgi:hypothetical protein